MRFAIALLLLSVTCLAQETKMPPLPRMSVPPGMPEITCACQTWGARYAEYNRRADALTHKAEGVLRRLAHLQRKAPRAEYDKQVDALVSQAAGCVEEDRRLALVWDDLEFEKKAHDKKYGDGIRHVAPSVLGPQMKRGSKP